SPVVWSGGTGTTSQSVPGSSRFSRASSKERSRPHRRRLSPSPPRRGRLAIAVAHLEHDKDQEHETLLLDELRQFEGVEAVSVDRTVDPEQPDKKIAEEEARGLLKQTGADVLVWGSVI